MQLQQIGVVGAGTMGAGIAEICARAGAAVTVVEVNEASAGRARERIERSLARAVRARRLTDHDAQRAAAGIELATELDSLSGCDLVVEASPEVESLKLDLFRRLDGVAPASAILASNTSSIPLVKMASVTNRPDQVVGLHFFNPAPVLPLGEVVASLLTSEHTLQTVTDFAEKDLGKSTIRSQDRAGFIVNALLIPYLLSAIRMLQSGFASAEDIDAGMVQGCAHPQGPLALTDLIGLDTTAAVAQSMYEEFKEPLYL